LEEMLIEKQKKIEKMELENRELGKMVKKMKEEHSSKTGMQESQVLGKEKIATFAMPQVPFIG
jgi:hypothetical protein